MKLAWMAPGIARQCAETTSTATWQGNLGAFITPCGGKRAWMLGWREKAEGTVGAYEYSGRLVERDAGGIFTVSGKFSWFGKLRGNFDFNFSRTAHRAPRLRQADDAVTSHIRSLFATMMNPRAGNGELGADG